MNILLVDDNTDYLVMMKHVLFSHGYTVHTAENGQEGCDLLSSHEFDLIVSDIKMPKFDGIRLHAYARELDRYKNTHFVFISGYKDIYSEAIHIDPKIDYFLDKTTPVPELLKFIDRLVFGNFAQHWS